MELIISDKDQKWSGIRDTFKILTGEERTMDYLVSLCKEIVHKRKLILDLAKADFKKRFVGSYFGIVWMFLQPLATCDRLFLRIPAGDSRVCRQWTTLTCCG